jgi:hypothetical protein
VAPAVALVAVLAPVISGCGSGTPYANNPRPATPIVVTAEISSSRVSVSPNRFGAGPIELVITNQDTVQHPVTFETNEIGGSTAGIVETTGPINPQGTASFKVGDTQHPLASGTYSVHVGPPGRQSSQIAPATVHVGPVRPSAQNQLLQP